MQAVLGLLLCPQWALLTEQHWEKGFCPTWPLNESCHISTELHLDKKQFSCTMAISNISGHSCDHKQIIICHLVTPALSSKDFSCDCEVFVRIKNGQNSTCGFLYLHYFALCFAVFLGMILQLQVCVFDVYCHVYKHFEWTIYIGF